jgi:hypothetical protein
MGGHPLAEIRRRGQRQVAALGAEELPDAGGRGNLSDDARGIAFESDEGEVGEGHGSRP